MQNSKDMVKILLIYGIIYHNAGYENSRQTYPLSFDNLDIPEGGG